MTYKPQLKKIWPLSLVLWSMVTHTHIPIYVCVCVCVCVRACLMLFFCLLSIHQRILKLNISWSPQKYETAWLFLTLIIIRNVFWTVNHHIRMISVGSCDTEDWSNDAENSALITEINYILTYIHTGYFTILLYFWFNQKHIKKLNYSNFWVKCTVYNIEVYDRNTWTWLTGT